MNFMVRPSKSFLFDLLEKKLGKIRGGVGLDAAAENFKNRRMFKTDRYFGLDINLKSLKEGLAKYDSDNTFGILADLTKLDLLPSDSVDVVVSTNTLYHIPAPQRLTAIKHLCRLIARAGYFLCELPMDEHFDESLKIMKKNFREVKIIYYKNFISRGYEKIFERNGYLGSHPVAGRRSFRLFAWLLSRLEYLTCSLPYLNKNAFIVCTNKFFGEKNVFDLSRAPLIDNRIYDLLKK